jgi:uncharacterized membrane protein (UPF0127 family)
LSSFLTPWLQAPEERFVLRNGRGNTIVARHIEPAFDSASRRRGLLGRTAFAEESALIIAPCSSIHTFFMRIVIDVVFVSRGGQVIKTYSALPAWRIAFGFSAFAAIELPSGTVERSDTRRGDQLLLAIE